MNVRRFTVALAAVASLGAFAAQPAVAQQTAPVRCDLTYSLSGWSLFYKTAKGDGTIQCSNGQSAKVVISVKGGGVSFGKTDIVDGKGTFSGVRDIKEVFGGYAAASAEAGAGESAGAHVMTKGNVSLALAGTGKGVDIGVDFGSFQIKPAE